MKDYIILHHPTADELTDWVRRHLEEGWEPVGGLVVVPAKNGVTWAQAMKVERDEEG